MNNNPLVSMIIPIYNVSEYIESSVKSAFSQSYGNIEFIFVDDCGSDDSMKKLESLCATTTRNYKIVRHLKNCGLSVARNTGIHNANGDFIFFMDSDDSLSIDCIAVHVKAILETGADWTDSNVNIVGGCSHYFLPYCDLKTVEDSRSILCAYLENIVHLSAWNKLIKKQFLLDNNIFFEEGLIYEDRLWMVELCRASSKMVQIPNSTYNYIIRPNSLTTNINNIDKQYASVEIILNKAIECIGIQMTSEVKESFCKWATSIRFIYSARLAASNSGFDIERKLYSRLNSRNISDYNKGLIGHTLKLPYLFFKVFFGSAYKLYCHHRVNKVNI